jgi:hypothetical protein
VTQGNQVPLVTFEVVGTTKEQATQTVEFLADTFDRNVVALQDAYGAPKTEKITTRRLDLGSNVTESNSKMKRALVAVAGAGVLLTAALTISMDAFLRRRTRKAAKTEATPTAPIADPIPVDTLAATPPILLPPQRNGSAMSAAVAAARPSNGERVEEDRTVVIRQSARARARAAGEPVNGGAAGDEAKKGAAGGKATPPGESTIVLPNNVYGSVHRQRGDEKDRRRGEDKDRR